MAGFPIFLGKVRTKRLDNRENDFTGLRQYCISLYEVEEAIGV